VKKEYKKIVQQQIDEMDIVSIWSPVKLSFVIYANTNARLDLGNRVSIQRKFFEDALVELWVIPDDNYNYILWASDRFGGVDKWNGRCEIIILTDSIL
jgi:hypothetical protein